MSILHFVRSRILMAFVVLGVALVVAVACNGDGDDRNGETPANGDTPAAGALDPQPDSPQQVEDEVTVADDGVIETEMGDNFYTRNNLKAPLGEALTIRATNTGQATHNLRIAGVDGEWNTDDDVVSDPEIVAPGEVGAVEFTPEIAGAYTFRCDFHPLEQGGVLVVE